MQLEGKCTNDYRIAYRKSFCKMISQNDFRWRCPTGQRRNI